MATFNQVFEKDATFIFGSWVCVSDGTGDWNRQLKPDEQKVEQRNDIDDLVEKFGEMKLDDLVGGREYVSKTIKTQAPASFLELEPSDNSTGLTLGGYVVIDYSWDVLTYSHKLSAPSVGGYHRLTT